MEDSTLGSAAARRRSTCSRARGDKLHDSKETEDQSEDIDPELRIRSRDLPEWLEEFNEHVVDEEASVSSDAPASTSLEPPHQELSRKVVSGTHSIFLAS